jgi:hypothetical protein
MISTGKKLNLKATLWQLADLKEMNTVAGMERGVLAP